MSTASFVRSVFITPPTGNTNFQKINIWDGNKLLVGEFASGLQVYEIGSNFDLSTVTYISENLVFEDDPVEKALRIGNKLYVVDSRDENILREYDLEQVDGDDYGLTLDSLVAPNTYYVRAFSEGEYGYSYGAEVSFSIGSDTTAPQLQQMLQMAGGLV